MRKVLTFLILFVLCRPGLAQYQVGGTFTREQLTAYAIQMQAAARKLQAEVEDQAEALQQAKQRRPQTVAPAKPARVRVPLGPIFRYTGPAKPAWIINPFASANKK